MNGRPWVALIASGSVVGVTRRAGDAITIRSPALEAGRRGGMPGETWATVRVGDASRRHEHGGEEHEGAEDVRRPGPAPITTIRFHDFWRQ